MSLYGDYLAGRFSELSDKRGLVDASGSAFAMDVLDYFLDSYSSNSSSHYATVHSLRKPRPFPPIPPFVPNSPAAIFSPGSHHLFNPSDNAGNMIVPIAPTPFPFLSATLIRWSAGHHSDPSDGYFLNFSCTCQPSYECQDCPNATYGPMPEAWPGTYTWSTPTTELFYSHSSYLHPPNTLMSSFMFCSLLWSSLFCFYYLGSPFPSPGRNVFVAGHKLPMSFAHCSSRPQFIYFSSPCSFTTPCSLCNYILLPLSTRCHYEFFCLSLVIPVCNIGIYASAIAEFRGTMCIGHLEDGCTDACHSTQLEVVHKSS